MKYHIRNFYATFHVELLNILYLMSPGALHCDCNNILDVRAQDWRCTMVDDDAGGDGAERQ